MKTCLCLVGMLEFFPDAYLFSDLTFSVDFNSVQFAVAENGVELIDMGMYVHPPEAQVTEMYPLSGPVEGGTLISVVGSWFVAEHPPFCQFGDLLEVQAKVCLKPPIHHWIFKPIF